jgi:hypothetical protein
MTIRTVGAEMFHADGRSYRHDEANGFHNLGARLIYLDCFVFIVLFQLNR